MPYNIGYLKDVPTTQGYIPGVHEGLDSCGSTGCPLYAPARSLVREVVRVGESSGAFGAATSGVYVALQVLGNRPETEVVTVQKHMAPLVVVEEGQTVEAGQHIGYQGWTGYVEPAGPGGEHCHQDVFVAHNGDYYSMERRDPAPYFVGGESLIIDPEPIPEPAAVPIVTIPSTPYEYIDTPARVRSAPSTSAAVTGAQVATGDGIWVNALANADGYTWGRIDAGWVAIAQGDTAWAVPVGAPDQSAEVAQLQADVSRVTGELAQRTQERDYKQGQLEQIKQIIG